MHIFYHRWVTKAAEDSEISCPSNKTARVADFRNYFGRSNDVHIIITLYYREFHEWSICCAWIFSFSGHRYLGNYSRFSETDLTTV